MFRCPVVGADGVFDPYRSPNKQTKTQKVRALFERNGDSKQKGLDVTQYLVGMAALDPCTVHAGPWNVERSHYIFRAYDANQTGLLEFSEFTDMVQPDSALHHFVNLDVLTCVPGSSHAPRSQRKLER
jgi:Ca2+-binding EF-hand superfamily protein